MSIRRQSPTWLLMLLAATASATACELNTYEVETLPVEYVRFSPDTLTLAVSQARQLSPILGNNSAPDRALRDRVVEWSSDRTSVATVSSAGVVTAVAGGTATITARSEGRTGAMQVAVLHYMEDFDDGLAQNWTPKVASDWAVVSGTYRARRIGNTGWMQSMYTGGTWANATVSVTARRSGSPSNAAVVFMRASQDFNPEVLAGSAFEVGISGGGGFWVGRTVNGEFRFLQMWTGSEFLRTDGGDNRIDLTLEGTRVQVRLNGGVAWEGTDSSVMTAGYIGLWAYTTTQNETIHSFDNVTVRPPLR